MMDSNSTPPNQPPPVRLLVVIIRGFRWIDVATFSSPALMPFRLVCRRTNPGPFAGISFIMVCAKT
jgi:hypothetical protein